MEQIIVWCDLQSGKGGIKLQKDKYVVQNPEKHYTSHEISAKTEPTVRFVRTYNVRMRKKDKKKGTTS